MLNIGLNLFQLISCLLFIIFQHLTQIENRILDSIAWKSVCGTSITWQPCADDLKPNKSTLFKIKKKYIQCHLQLTSSKGFEGGYFYDNL